MRYVKLDTRDIVSIYDVRSSLPNMSIPDGADMSAFGFAPVTEGDYPSAEKGQVIVEGPAEFRDGKWFSTYVIKQGEAPTVYVPDSVSMGQARLALFDLGKLDAVTTFINSLPEAEKQRALIEWEYRPTVERQSALVLQLGKALNLDLDALFIAAEQL